ncbi:GNAT family N-acetyltransferase [Sinosporangium siamense]|nr:GNAT family N-acetyltransferase [Sinosporangium siamense]
MPAVRAIAEKFGLLHGWPPGRDFLDAERAFGTLLLAPTADGQARGFGGTLRRGPVTHLGDLFVAAEHQSSGVGRALLAELLKGDEPKVTFASSDPRAMSLYIRYGLRPWCPLLYLTGPAAGVAGPAVREARLDDVADLDALAGGGARPETLAWFAATPGVTWHTTGSGYAFARVSGDVVVIGPAGGATPRDCAEAVLGAISRVSGAATAPLSARIAVPGVHPLVSSLIEAGWRIGDLDTFMADDDALSLVRPDRYVPHPDLG